LVLLTHIRIFFIPCLKGSSIGSYTTQWLNEFYRSAIGREDERWLDLPLKRRKQQEWPSVKIVYPSLQTVQASILGPPVCPSHPKMFEVAVQKASVRVEEQSSVGEANGMLRLSLGISFMIPTVNLGVC
jgi:hypothetical protein